MHEGSILIVDSLNIVLKPVGLEPTQPGKPLAVYPNPAHDFIMINGEGLQNNSRFYLFNSDGKLVLNRKTSVRKINVRTLPAGLYFYRIEDGDRTISGKLNIMR